MKRALCLLVLAGCPDPEAPPDNVEIFAITAAPPASIANITNDDNHDIYSIELSQGVAIAARCWDNCDTPCTTLTVTPGDSTLLAVRPVYRLNGGDAELALIATGVGKTTLHVETSCAQRDYTVTLTKR